MANYDSNIKVNSKLIDIDAINNQTVVYISGAISSDRDFFEKFDRIENVFRNKYKNVINPARLANEAGYTLKSSYIKVIAFCFDLLHQANKKYLFKTLCIIEDDFYSPGKNMEFAWCKARGWNIVTVKYKKE